MCVSSIQDASAQGSPSVAPNGRWISSASGLELFAKKAYGMSVAGPPKRSALLVNRFSRVIPKSHGPQMLISCRCRATLWCRKGYKHCRRCTAVPRDYHCGSFSSCHKLKNAAFFIYSEPCSWSAETCVNGFVHIRRFPAHWCNCGSVRFNILDFPGFHCNIGALLAPLATQARPKGVLLLGEWMADQGWIN